MTIDNDEETDLWPASTHFEALPQGRFTRVRHLSPGINGHVFQYQYHLPGEAPVSVAVKQLRQEALDKVLGTERDERKVHFCESSARAPSLENALVEIGTLQRLARQEDLSPYILRLHGVFSSTDGAWLVTELANQGELFQRVNQSGVLPPLEVRRFSQQVMQALVYLHGHQIGHRDISLENLLLKDGDVKLMDFGQAARTATPEGTALRYFRKTGKGNYRAPEIYVPRDATVDVFVPAEARAGDVVAASAQEDIFCEVRLPEGACGVCKAEVSGYTLPPADVWSTAVCIFIMLTGIPPWTQAIPSDRCHSYALARGAGALLRSRRAGLPTAAQELVSSMLVLQPSLRPTAEGCLSATWLRDEPAGTAAVAP